MASTERSQISLRTPVEMIAKFDRLAVALDRDRSWVLLQALQFYLDREGNDILSDSEGIAAVDRGETVEWQDALKRIDGAIARGAATRLKKAG
jgi:predicted transcriptional regulator